MKMKQITHTIKNTGEKRYKYVLEPEKNEAL